MDKLLVLTKHYMNPVDEAMQQAVALINQMVKKSKVTTGKIELIGNAKITVVAIEQHPTKYSRILNFGVARCSQFDEFKKYRGLAIAMDRATEFPSITFEIPKQTPHENIMVTFNAIADTLNARFMDGSQNHYLEQIRKPPKKKTAVKSAGGVSFEEALNDANKVEK